MTETMFDERCARCKRLAGYLQQVRTERPEYYCKPVTSFGDTKAVLLIVGLAPGKHGANATGRPFTGDYAGILLYEMLYRFGFSSCPLSRTRSDGLQLNRCRITNAVKCLPPDNRPLTSEIVNCNAYLASELGVMPTGGVVLALGTIAHNAVLRALNLKQSQFRFSHAGHHVLPNGLQLLDSYHCSRYNLQTRRLTSEMFEVVFQTVSFLVRDIQEDESI